MARFLWAVEDIFWWEHTLPVMLVFIAVALEVLNKMQVTLLELLFKMSENKQIWFSVESPFCFFKSSYISASSIVAPGVERSSLTPAQIVYWLSR